MRSAAKLDLKTLTIAKGRSSFGGGILRGSAGNDTLTGGTGADAFDGGTGTDTATDYKSGEEDTKTNIP